jgi:Bacterial SH3 domain
VHIHICRLLIVSVVLLGACRPPPAERPLEGAPPGGNSPHANPAPPATLGGAPPTLAVPTRPAADGAPVSTPPPPPSPTPAHVIGATDGTGANLRTAPSTAAPVIATLREGTPVEILGDPITSEGRQWRPVRGGDQQGWVLAVVVRPR